MQGQRVSLAGIATVCAVHRRRNVRAVVTDPVNTIRKQKATSEATCLMQYTHDDCSTACKDVPTVSAPTTCTPKLITGTDHAAEVTPQSTVLLALCNW